MNDLTYAILGSGALGGLYGARLARAGAEVHFLLRSDYEHVRAHGLRIDSKDGDFHLPNVNAYANVEDMPRCEVVIVALKTTMNHLLPQLLPPVVKQGGIVLTLQNGLGVEAQAAEAAPGAEVLGGLCFLCSNKVGPGHIHHLDYGEIRLGRYTPDGRPGGITDTMRRIAADLNESGTPTTLMEHLELARWQKLVWNVPFNGLSVILDATTDRIMADAHGRRLAEALMLEVVEGAGACGLPIDRADVDDMLDRTVRMTPYRTSMMIDHDRGQPMEVEAIFGAPLRAAREAGAATPKLEMVYELLKFLDGGAVVMKTQVAGHS